jgi:hypothetical protein
VAVTASRLRTADAAATVPQVEIRLLKSVAMVAPLPAPELEGFGEIALIEDVPRTATVTTPRDDALYSLEKDEFLLAVTGHAPVARASRDLVARRLDELRSI